VKAAQVALSIGLCAIPAAACTSIAPKNPVKAAALCGRAQDPTGSPISDFDLRLVRENQEVVAEVHSDAKGDFQFAPVIKGTYYMTTMSRGWQLGAAVRVTSSKGFTKCRHPLIVQPSLGGCGGGISKKGYRPKY
jgi:hypothetical protein